ncbi:hypothetical protein ACFFWB_26960 [Flavobacterium procerum]|uniref:hypothetical protein n=1 Tax=Flavobacterium procerum TaxID=1455569 RepID=UPI0035EE09EA
MLLAILGANDGSSYTIFYDQNKNHSKRRQKKLEKQRRRMEIYHKASKVLMSVENYKKGVLHGVKIIYFQMRKVAEEMNFVKRYNRVYKKLGQEGTCFLKSQFTKICNDGDADL